MLYRSFHPFSQSHIGRPGNQEGGKDTVIHLLFDIAPQDVRKGCHELPASIDEMQNVADVYLRKRIEKGMVDRLTTTGIYQRPAALFSPSFDFKVFILTGGDTPVDFGNAIFKPLLERCEMVLDRLLKDGQTGVRNQIFLLLPLSIIYKIVLETSESDAIPTENIARFQSIP